MFFHALHVTFVRSRESFLTRGLKGESFTTPSGLADLSASENHVWSLLLHKVILSLEIFGKTLRNVHFYITILTDFNYATLTSPYTFQKPVECKLPLLR